MRLRERRRAALPVLGEQRDALDEAEETVEPDDPRSAARPSGRARRRGRPRRGSRRRAVRPRSRCGGGPARAAARPRRGRPPASSPGSATISPPSGRRPRERAAPGSVVRTSAPSSSTGWSGGIDPEAVRIATRGLRVVGRARAGARRKPPRRAGNTVSGRQRPRAEARSVPLPIRTTSAAARSSPITKRSASLPPEISRFEPGSDGIATTPSMVCHEVGVEAPLRQPEVAAVEAAKPGRKRRDLAGLLRSSANGSSPVNGPARGTRAAAPHPGRRLARPSSSCASAPPRRASGCRDATPRAARRRPSGSTSVDEHVGDLLAEALLDGEAPREQPDEAGQLRDADDPLAGDVADVGVAEEGQRVVLAERGERDRPLDDLREGLPRLPRRSRSGRSSRAWGRRRIRRSRRRAPAGTAPAWSRVPGVSSGNPNAVEDLGDVALEPVPVLPRDLARVGEGSARPTGSSTRSRTS